MYILPGISPHNSAQHFIKLNYARKKNNNTLRRSASFLIVYFPKKNYSKYTSVSPIFSLLALTVNAYKQVTNFEEISNNLISDKVLCRNPAKICPLNICLTLYPFYAQRLL